MALDDLARPKIAGADDLLEDFFENGAVGLHVVAGDGTILRANKAELSLLGYAAEEYVGRNIADFHADEPVIGDILDRLGKGETLDKYPARLRAKDGSLRHVLISSSVRFDEAGGFRNTRCFTLDVTDRVLAEQALEEARQRLAATYENALVGIAEVDAEGRILRVNAQYEQITGHPRERLLGITPFDITDEADVADDRTQFAAQVRGDIATYAVEKRFVRADGRRSWVRVSSSSVRGADGRFLYAVRVVQDISAHRLASERSAVLVNELNHRVKNTLATVQSLASQTARRASDVTDFMARFEGRIVALSGAHDRLTQCNWESANLRDIVADELQFRAGAGRSVAYEGPDVALPPQAALALSMALHELATNAVKYGALRTPEGRVAVNWTVGRDRGLRPMTVRFEWRESGGPPVKPPKAKGFGTRLLAAMAAELEGEGNLAFAPTGVSWTLTFPLKDRGAARA